MRATSGNQVQSIQIGKAQVDDEGVVNTFQGYGLTSFCCTGRIYLVSGFRQRPPEELLNGNVVFYHQQSHRRFPPVQDFTPPDGMQETGSWETHLTSKSSIYCRRQVMSTRTGISFLTGMVRSDGGSILKSESVAGMIPVIWVSPLCFSTLKGTFLYWTVCPAN